MTENNQSAETHQETNTTEKEVWGGKKQLINLLDKYKDQPEVQKDLFEVIEYAMFANSHPLREVLNTMLAIQLDVSPEMAQIIDNMCFHPYYPEKMEEKFAQFTKVLIESDAVEKYKRGLGGC